MAEYKIFFRRSVEKDVILIPRKDLQKVLRMVKGLSGDPRPEGSEKLSGQERYRLRHGRFRIVYSIEDDQLTMWAFKTGQRRDICG